MATCVHTDKQPWSFYQHSLPPPSKQEVCIWHTSQDDLTLPSTQDLVKQVLSALRAIAGNDDVKDAIVRAGGTESIVAAMTRHLASPQVLTSDTWAGQWPDLPPYCQQG